jgi:hypothetical protein
MNMKKRMPIKKRCMIKDDPILTRGKILTLNTTFLTRKLFSVIEYAAFDKLSEKNSQGVNPAMNHKIKGKLFTG